MVQANGDRSLAVMFQGERRENPAQQKPRKTTSWCAAK
jgi:hypothetical protein